MDVRERAARVVAVDERWAVAQRTVVAKLHLRAYLENPSKDFAWADLGLVPENVRALVAQTSRRKATASSTFQDGLFFDPTRNHDAWSPPAAHSGDAAAETSEADPDEVEAFRKQIQLKDFGVPDSIATAKTQG